MTLQEMLAADTISELQGDIVAAVQSALKRHGDDPAFGVIAASAFTLAVRELANTCGPKFEPTVIKGLQAL
ncbi:hypothetical protein M2323_003535 [Rhodoblastus acidophilus]|uniref:hypothetical protein n=1 Tax=Rhodoblastus acidophilus TaxID=1074 RepID=UPI002224C63E|nr:hypothetical protein [Rhodoblastus acidophilus]MCW2285648.1 hypothetical protein [Rhodoblastus acidophilus]MCW2334594.1 hypothetical protein [Rhodoblastus acidophilus]